MSCRKEKDEFCKFIFKILTSFTILEKSYDQKFIISLLPMEECNIVEHFL